MSDLVERVTRALDTWVDPDRVRDAVAVVLEEAATVIENECHDDMTRAEEAAAIRALKGR